MNIIIAILITTGLSLMASDYDGLADIFLKLRKSRLGKLFECSICLTPYIALIPFLGLPLTFMEYLAVVGASVLILRHV